MNEKYKLDFLRAGALAKEVRNFGKALIKKGASYQEILQKINQEIIRLKAKPAFPPQMALNDTAAHFLLGLNEDIQLKDEVVKLDVGVAYEGAIGDCAVTVDLSGKHGALIEAVEKALLNAEEIIEVGLKVQDIGRVIEKTITSYGFRPIKNLCGHGLGYYQIHTQPQIPNYADRSEAVIKPGMTFAIEPFATNGGGLVYESGMPKIYAFVKNKPIQSPIAKRLLTAIKFFSGLPFSAHNLLETNIPPEDIEKGLQELLAAGAIAGYPPLLEQKGGIVAQAENSVLVDRNKKVVITTR